MIQHHNYRETPVHASTETSLDRRWLRAHPIDVDQLREPREAAIAGGNSQDG